MEKEELQMTGIDSLHIIRQMIDTAKREQKDDGRGWIMWGWLLLAASVGTVLNMQFDWFSTFFFWNLFGLLVLLRGLYEVVIAFFVRRRVSVTTYTKDIFDKLNIGFFVCLMFIIIAMNTGTSPVAGFPLLMNLYGFWILIYGAMLSFRPSLIGAFVMWVLAFVALLIPHFMPQHDASVHFTWVMILHGVGVLCGYIVPGYIAQKEFRKAAARNLSNDSVSV